MNLLIYCAAGRLGAGRPIFIDRPITSPGAAHGAHRHFVSRAIGQVPNRIAGAIDALNRRCGAPGRFKVKQLVIRDAAVIAVGLRPTDAQLAIAGNVRRLIRRVGRLERRQEQTARIIALADFIDRRHLEFVAPPVNGISAAKLEAKNGASIDFDPVLPGPTITQNIILDGAQAVGSRIIPEYRDEAVILRVRGRPAVQIGRRARPARDGRAGGGRQRRKIEFGIWQIDRLNLNRAQSGPNGPYPLRLSARIAI